MRKHISKIPFEEFLIFEHNYSICILHNARERERESCYHIQLFIHISQNLLPHVSSEALIAGILIIIIYIYLDAHSISS